MSNYFYFAFGLKIKSDFKVAVFRSIDEEGDCDLTISVKKADLPKNYFQEKRVIRESKDRGYFIFIKNIAGFTITENLIQINPITEDFGLIESALLNEAFRTLLSLKGNTVFNGSALLINTKAYLFLSEPGMGKSALMASFYKRGYQVISDQFCIVKREKEKFKLTPDSLKLKLWHHTLKALDVKKDNLQKVRKELEKYYFETPFKKQIEKYEIAGIILLEISNHLVNDFESIKLNKIDSIKYLRHHLFKPEPKINKEQLIEDFAVVSKLSLSQCCINVSRSVSIIDILKHSSFVEQNILKA